MSANGKLHVAVVGLGFGWEFASIYKEHPEVGRVTVCDANAERLSGVTAKLGVKGTSDFNELLKDGSLDAVHLVTGIPDHASHSVAVLESGRHCACTVPMATSLDDLRRVVRAQRRSGRNYMMMETAVYTRQFLFAKTLRDDGVLGRIQFLRGAHYQDMEGWPPYWAGLPPMWYSTHALAPLLSLAESRATKVHCFGSGRMREELTRQYSNPWPVETAIFQLEKPALSAEATRSLFHCVRPYMESFAVYGEQASYEWQAEDEPPAFYRAAPDSAGKGRRRVAVEKPEPPDRSDLLTPEIRKFTRQFVYGGADSHLSFKQGGGHHGSHPHLVDEFVKSVVAGRKPAIDAVTAANWTAAGICAHESAMKGGKEVEIPSFE